MSLLQGGASKDPTYIDGKVKLIIKRLSKKKKMAEAVIREEEKKVVVKHSQLQVYLTET